MEVQLSSAHFGKGLGLQRRAALEGNHFFQLYLDAMTLSTYTFSFLSFQIKSLGAVSSAPHPCLNNAHFWFLTPFQSLAWELDSTSADRQPQHWLLLEQEGQLRASGASFLSPSLVELCCRPPHPSASVFIACFVWHLQVHGVTQGRKEADVPCLHRVCSLTGRKRTGLAD